MSTIPKIKLSSSRKREKVDLQTVTQTTTNFGYVSPVWCREMMPNSKFTVSVGSKVYLQPMPKPTFGQVYMDIKHVFVPYRDVCPQFDSFLASQPYTPAMGSSYVPQSLPYWNFGTIAQTVLARYADWTAYKVDYAQGTINPKYTRISIYNQSASEVQDVKDVWQMINVPAATNKIWGAVPSTNPSPLADKAYMPSYGNAIRSLADDSEGVMLLGDYFVSCDNATPYNDSNFAIEDPATGIGYIKKTPSDMYVSIGGADFLSVFNVNGSREYLIAFKLKPFGKRLRNILLGLGYSFNPHSLMEFSPNKLLAFYKAWFALYRPQREFSFTMTNCYALVKTLQDPNNINLLSSRQEIQLFLLDLARDCYAYLPQDYFGMSVRVPGQNFQGASDSIFSQSNSFVTSGSQQVNNQNSEVLIRNSGYQTQVSIGSSSGPQIPAVQSLAEKVLRYVNKNTIVGRNIHDFIKAHFGVSIDDSHDLDSVYLIGSSNVAINISDIFSSTSTNDAYLGQYGGLGQGQETANEKFYFENKDNFGIWLSMACVMPKSGYCQGYLRENRHLKKLEFFTPEFDAAGYQVLERGEISSDYPVSLPDYSVRSNIELDKAFGFVPRYSEYKVAKNIVSGDLSLRSYRNNMSCYTLERLIPYESDRVREVDTVKTVVPGAPKFVPTIVFDDFRRIDPTDTLGNYNRIFFEMDNKEDKFIVSQIFVVDAEIPAMSLSESFDTFDNDGKVVEIKHS